MPLGVGYVRQFAGLWPSLGSIWPAVRGLGGDPSRLGEALSAALADLKAHAAKALDVLARRLGSGLEGGLRVGAAEIPRQYRWTRKEAPTEPSPYITASLQGLQAFVTFALQRSASPPTRPFPPHSQRWSGTCKVRRSAWSWGAHFGRALRVRRFFSSLHL